MARFITRPFFVAKPLTAWLKTAALLVIIIASSNLAAHAVYISLCDIKADSVSGNYTASVVFFTDDLQLALQKQGHSADSLRIDQTSLLTLGQKYVAEHLRLQVNEEAIELQYDERGSRATKARIFLSFRFQYQKPVEKISASNISLFEVYREQQNMIRVTLGDQRLSLLLSAEMSSGELEF